MAWIERRIGGARIVFTDRHGGVSPAPYQSANLGLAVGDDSRRVAENRRRAAVAIGGAAAAGDRWAWLRQVHGAGVATVGCAIGPASCDAAVTGATGVPLAVLVADCAPIALVTDAAIGVVHAGWRGLEAGVVQAGVEALHALHDGPVGLDPGGAVRAVIGPCVQPDHYPFGATELDRLTERLGAGVRGRARDGSPALDLPAAVHAALSEAGVSEVDDVGLCTACSPDHFSHRRDGVTGRQALVAVREP